MTHEQAPPPRVTYTSPVSKTVSFFVYETVREVVEKKTTAFNFPDANGTYVQDLGHTGRRYPLRLFFWGENHDDEASVFMDSLLETGAGTLEHPKYGTKTVIPFGPITRRDDLVRAANQAVFDITFWETIDVIYPAGQNDAGASVLGALGAYTDAAAGELGLNINTGTVSLLTSFKNDYLAFLDVAEGALDAVADVQESVAKTFKAVNDAINRGIDILIARPLALAFQTMILLNAPARSFANIRARLAAYRNLAESIIGSTESTLTSIAQGGGVTTPSLAAKASNQFHTAELFASTAVAGSILSAVAGATAPAVAGAGTETGAVAGATAPAVTSQFLSKTAALEAAEDILAQMDTVTAWRDDAYATLDQIDTGASYQQLQDAVALCAGFLIEISFTLKQERRIILDRDRSIIDLAAELYGAIDGELDFLITSNNLSGSEIIELPRGREIVYYV